VAELHPLVSEAHVSVTQIVEDALFGI
jgi:hypothetical protein